MLETRVLDGRTFVHVKTLADQWHTTTSAILATGKPHQIPAKYRRTIDREAWVDVEGLRERVGNAKRPSNLDEKLGEWLLALSDTGKEQLLEDREKSMDDIILVECGKPEPGDIRHALDNKQVLWRRKNNHVQVLAQTLSNYLDTRTSSLLAVNKKQGVPAKYIHREWKQTWVDLEGLKQRVNHTEHESSLLKGLKQIIEILDDYKAAYTRPLIQDTLGSSASTAQVSASASAPGTKRKPIDVCDVAVEANKRAVHNTERLNKLETRLDNEPVNLQTARLNQLMSRVKYLEDRVTLIAAGDKQAVQAMKEKRTPLDALSKRVSSMVTHTDRLDAKTDGLESRVSVLEDTSKWLSWSLAGVLSLRFIGLMLHLLKRK